MLSCLLPDPNLTTFDDISVDENNKRIVCKVTATQSTTSCPLCSQPASRIHSHYQRTMADLPWAGIPVRILLMVRRFFCKNKACYRKIFTERIPTLAAPWARRTQRLAKAQQAIGLRAGASDGARLCTALAMDAGIDLLLALIRLLQTPAHQTPLVLGVDDWAKRKGQDYGTILVDLEQGQIVEILPDRTAEGLKRWLQAHPGVEIVARDRASAYAEGIREGAPDAIQVADRWHLLKNLTDAVYKVLQKHQKVIQKALLPQPSGQREETIQDQVSEKQLEQIETVSELSAADCLRQQRAEEAQRLCQQGWTVNAIAKNLGCVPKTVRSYLNTELPLTPQRRLRRGRLLDPYVPYLVERWNAGCHNAAQLHREIQSQGFCGQITVVRDFSSKLRLASGIPPGIRNAQGQIIHHDPSQRPPTLRKLAHLTTGLPEDRNEVEKEYLERLGGLHPDLQLTLSLAQTLAAMIRQRQVELLDQWFEQAHSSPLQGLAASLQRDEAAVRAALSLKWSNGPTEGHINRLKCLKRQMYGRAKLDLLRLRLLAA